ncbi:hypothetical protein WAA24_004349 [Stenotrophomonas maltophilia]
MRQHLSFIEPFRFTQCEATGKRGYSYSEARRFLATRKRAGWHVAVTSVYRCAECNRWHLASLKAPKAPVDEDRERVPRFNAHTWLRGLNA